MKNINDLFKCTSLVKARTSGNGMLGHILHPQIPRTMFFVASWDFGWEHVSVSYKDRTPTWDEMCIVKDIFWNEDETVIQIHPPKKEYVNLHPHCLHLWRKKDSEPVLPPKELV